jgi:hypothetical protein
MKLRLLVPQVKTLPEGRLTACSYCQRPLLQRHRAAAKPSLASTRGTPKPSATAAALVGASSAITPGAPAPIVKASESCPWLSSSGRWASPSGRWPWPW